MVLEIKIPHSTGDIPTWHDLMPMLPTFISYILSFIYVGIYWNNHHHMLHTVKEVKGCILWANLHLLFWLSLVPVATEWIGTSHFANVPVAAYGILLLLTAIAFLMLQNTIIRNQGEHSVLKKAVGSDWKAKASVTFYSIAVLLAFRYPKISAALYAVVAVMWFVPDRRIEKVLREN